MSVSDLDTAAVLFDFVELFLDDQRTGANRTLDEYLERFPGHADAIRAEFARLTGSLPLRDSDDPTPTPTPAGFHEGAVLDLAGPDRSITRYRILGEIGRGGQAAVYLAIDEELGRKVALKVLRERWDAHAARSLDRLRREVRIVAGLDHPALCQVYQAYLDRHPPCIAMRYVEGRTLGARIAGCAAAGASDGLCAPRRPDELRRLLQLIERVARALHAAHESGVVHRDVKPANIMVDLRSDPVVLDFGLALQSDSDVTLTDSGENFGTPAYMSPEQIEGRSRDLDGRTDVYSLGVTLFEALTLRRPFEGPSRRHLERAICNERAPDPATLNAAVPRDVRTVLETAMEKDPDQRYATALEFAEDLRRIRLFEPIQARPAGARVRFLRWMQRNPAVATATLALIVSLTAGLVLALALLAEVRVANAGLEARQLAHDALVNLDTDPSRSLEIALQSLGREWTEDANTALMTALAECRLESVLGRKVADVTAMQPSPEGRLAALGYGDGRWETWDLRDRRRLQRSDTSSPIRDVAFGADAGVLYTAHADGTLRHYDATTGSLRRSVQGPADADTIAAADGLLAASFRDGSVAVWDLETDELTLLGQQPISAHVIELHSSSGRVLTATGATAEAASSTDPVARIWSITEPGSVVELRGHGELINHATFSPDGRTVATASHDGTARVWDAASGAALRTLAHPERVIHTEFSPDGRLLLTTYDPGDPMAPTVSGATLWDATSYERLVDLAGHEGRLVSTSLFSRDSSRVATAGYDGVVRVWETATGRVLETLRGPAERLFRLAWSADEERILAWDARDVFVWNLAPRDVMTLDGHDGAVLDAAYAADGHTVATAGSDGSVGLWDASSGRLVRRLDHDGSEVTALAFQPRGRLLATARLDGTIFVWDPSTGTQRRQHRHGSPPTGLRFSPDGAHLLSTGADGMLVLLDVDGGESRTSPVGHDGAVVCARFSPDGRTIATGGTDRTCRLWDGLTLQPIAVLDDWSEPSRSPPRQKHVFDVAFGTDGRQLTTATEDGHLRLYDLADGPPRLIASLATTTVGWLASPADERPAVAAHKWMGQVVVRDGWLGERVVSKVVHAARLTDVALAPDGQRLLTTSLDGTAVLSRLPGLGTWVRLLGHDDFLTVGRFSPDGTQVVTASKDGTARLWPTDPAPAARRRLPIDLTSTD